MSLTLRYCVVDNLMELVVSLLLFFFSLSYFSTFLLFFLSICFCINSNSVSRVNRWGADQMATHTHTHTHTNTYTHHSIKCTRSCLNFLFILLYCINLFRCFVSHTHDLYNVSSDNIRRKFPVCLIPYCINQSESTCTPLLL